MDENRFEEAMTLYDNTMRNLEDNPDEQDKLNDEFSTQPAPINYVLLLPFSRNADKLLLIRKKYPDWQIDKLNGLGGIMKPAETPIEAAVRKFENETGIKTEHSMWRHFATITYSEAVLYCVVMRSNVIFQYGSRGEEVILFNVQDVVARKLADEIMQDLHHLVPMALYDGIRHARIEAFG